MKAEAGSRAVHDPDTAASRAMRARGIVARAPALVIAAALAVFAIAYAMDWRLPGLYMDAVNPEYIIPGIFDPTAPGHHPWILPGNLILGRFPLFTGQVYHGSTQIYFALPLMALFGVDVGTLRIVQGAAGFVIVLLLAIIVRRPNAPAKSAIAAAAMLPLALDPSFVVALRTQAYSCLFPLVLLLGAILLIRGWQTKPQPALRLFASGVLFGLSVFSYFIFAFFFPALVWFVLTERERASPRDFRYLGVWLFACGVGYLPVIGGLCRIAQALGSFHAMLHWLHGHGDRLHPFGSAGAAPDRVRTMFTVARGVLTGRWPWLMVLQHHAGDFTGSLKAALLVGVPVAALAAARPMPRADRRAVATPLVFVVSFLAGASIFGNRLDGHHYTTLVPFLYAAFGAACAALYAQPAEPHRPPLAARALPAAGIALLVAIGAINAFNLARFHRDLEASGGAGLYSDAIDRFAHHVAKDDPDATAYFPDWGYVMPFVFVTRARNAQRDSVDPARIARESCAGRPQIVVFTGAGNAAKFDVVTALAGQPPPAITTWSQRDGAPVFQSARYAPHPDCADTIQEAAPAPALHAAPSIALAPAAASDCGFLSPIAVTARWDAGNPALERVEVWISLPGDKPKLWAAGAERSESRTGQWATPGMAFTLVDPVTQATLAHTEIGRIACPVH